jgi:proton glutamate symport protein
LIEIVPPNVFDAMARGNMLQILFFSIFFGIATAVAGKRGEPIINLASSVSEVMFIFTRYVMKLAPLGIFSTIAFTVGKFGLEMLLPLGKLILTVYLALSIFIIFVLIVATYFVQVNFFQLMRSTKEPLLLAFVTASSETALPMLIERLEKFGVPRHIVTFVLPTGYSFNLDGATLYTAIAVVFIAQVYGIPLNWGQQLLLVLTLMVTTKGMAAIPGGAMVAIAGTVTALGLPIEGVALILGVDRILDMGRTATNVIGNAVATVVIARWESALSDEVLKESYVKSYESNDDLRVSLRM